jgi:L-ascorbate metabolism protein UlaG (beta-lactamase superfamily)
MLEVFGKNPSGERLRRIQQSINYKDSSFQNLLPTEVMLKGVSIFKMLKDFANKPKSVLPSKAIPSVKTNLKNISYEAPTIVWFGHSSYIIISKEITILVDPVLDSYASPVEVFGKPFAGASVYSVEDLPKIDIVLLTHDHYDHLDFKTIKKLISKKTNFYAALGVGAHLERWGVSPEQITEFDWWEKKTINDNIEIISVPSRHFSGRGITRGKTLWSAFVLKLNLYNLFLGGDSGYDGTFKNIGEEYGPFDLAILETGQYGENWPYIHMKPEESVQAALDLKARVILPVHWAKFTLAFHEWNDPIIRVRKAAALKHLRVTTPRIGEPVVLEHSYPESEWWL